MNFEESQFLSFCMKDYSNLVFKLQLLKNIIII